MNPTKQWLKNVYKKHGKKLFVGGVAFGAAIALSAAYFVFFQGEEDMNEYDEDEKGDTRNKQKRRQFKQFVLQNSVS